MRDDRSIVEKIFGIIIHILWFIFTPIEIIIKYILNFIKKLFIDTGKSVYSRLISWLSLIGFVILISIILGFLKD